MGLSLSRVRISVDKYTCWGWHCHDYICTGTPPTWYLELRELVASCCPFCAFMSLLLRSKWQQPRMMPFWRMADGREEDNVLAWSDQSAGMAQFSRCSHWQTNVAVVYDLTLPRFSGHASVYLGAWRSHSHRQLAALAELKQYDDVNFSQSRTTDKSPWNSR